MASSQPDQRYRFAAFAADDHTGISSVFQVSWSESQNSFEDSESQQYVLPSGQGFPS